MPALSALTAAFPEDVLPEHVSEEAFLWASQLWYSYGMEVHSYQQNPSEPATDDITAAWCQRRPQ